MSNLEFNVSLQASDFLHLTEQLDALEEACKSKDEQIDELEYQLSNLSESYKTLLEYMNSEKSTILTKEAIGELTAHQLLRGRQILVVGACCCKPKNLIGYAKKTYRFANNDFRFISDYAKIKNREIKLRFDKMAGIIVGPIPHYAEGASNDLLKFIRDWQDIVPVLICKSRDGVIKISKWSFADSLMRLMSELEESY